MKMKVKSRTILVHAALWTVYVALEYLANIYHIQDGSEYTYMRSIILTIPLIMIPTYFVVWVIVPRFLKTGKLMASIISFSLVIVFVFYGRILWLDIMYNSNFILSGRIPAPKIFKNVIRDYSVIALAVCIYLLADWRQKQKLNEELLKTKAEAELKLLKGQLHPHFLFNTLNNIYSLALIESDLTADAILKLTDLLDYLVYKANSKSVPLSKEVQLINTYLDLESLRHDEALVIERKIEASNLNVPIAPLVMLPFVENCFKHGGPGADGVFKIHIAIAFYNKTLVFNINNTLRPDIKQFIPSQGSGDSVKRKNVSVHGAPEQEGFMEGGVGLSNIRRRLDLIYPDRHRLEIVNNVDHHTVNLTIMLTDEL